MSKQLEWTTEKRKVNEVLPLEFNPRKITEAKRKKLIQSLEKFNLAEIPAINKDNTVISGNQRLKALQLMGRGDELIDVRVPNRKLTQKELKEYAVIANTHAGEWDVDIFEEFFGDVDLEDMGLSMDDIKMPDVGDMIGAEGEEEKILEAEEDNFDIPPENEIQTDIVTGDLIEIGNHRLLCGDSTNVDDVKTLMGEGIADMVFQAPPYNVKISGLGSSAWKTSIGKIHGEFKMASSEMNREEFISFLILVFNNNCQTSKDGSIHYNCMDWRHIYEISYAINNCYSEFKNLCVWNKDNGGMGTFYRSKHELIFVTKNGKSPHTNNFKLGETGRYRTNVWDYPIVHSFALQKRVNNKSAGNDDIKLHPTVKPIKMVADAILDCSNKGEIIEDLFLGSGTTMVASEQMKRKCYGMEIDPKYCQVIVNRMLKLDPTLQIKRNGKPWTTPKIS